MIRYAIEAAPAVEADVEAAFDWYEGEEPELGFEFLEELRAAYHRIARIIPSDIRLFVQEFAAP